MISNMDNDSRDFANNFAEYMRKALIKDMVASQYKTQLESLYKQAGEYAKAGTLDDHVEELRDQYWRLAASAQGQARMIDSITGYSETDSQKATVNETRSLSEDTGSQIVGLITAIQIAVERGNAQRGKHRFRTLQYWSVLYRHGRGCGPRQSYCQCPGTNKKQLHTTGSSVFPKRRATGDKERDNKPQIHRRRNEDFQG